MTGTDGPSKASGQMHAAQGTVKETLGKIIPGTTGDRIEAEGAAKKAEGNAEVHAAKVKGRAEGGVDHMAGNIKKNVGDLIGNERMQAEGQARATKGEIKQNANKF